MFSLFSCFIICFNKANPSCEDEQITMYNTFTTDYMVMSVSKVYYFVVESVLEGHLL